jgi:hypothetical protein
VMLVLSSIVVLAVGFDDEGNPNDPTVNERANACYETGSMETKCGNNDWNKNGVVDSYEIQWDWTCGWYLIRFEYELVSREDFPTQCSILLPSEREEVVEEVVETINLACLGPTIEGLYADFSASNVLNPPVTVYSGPTCENVFNISSNVWVYAPGGSSEAATFCPFGTAPIDFGSDIWVCAS